MANGERNHIPSSLSPSDPNSPTQLILAEDASAKENKEWWSEFVKGKKKKKEDGMSSCVR
jgi:hypothetical protein